MAFLFRDRMRSSSFSSPGKHEAPHDGYFSAIPHDLEETGEPFLIHVQGVLTLLDGGRLEALRPAEGEQGLESRVNAASSWE